MCVADPQVVRPLRLNGAEIRYFGDARSTWRFGHGRYPRPARRRFVFVMNADSNPGQADDAVEAPTGVKGLRALAMRERIIDAAASLFYADGIRAVSADRVISEVGITKVTFYRYFPAKDDLVVAYLERRSEVEREAVNRMRSALPGDPVALFRALAAAAGEESCAPGFRGCPFINAAAEYPNPAHPVRQAVDRHRRWFKALVEQQLELLDIKDAPLVADRLIMLRDGAMVSGYLSDPATVGQTLPAAVQAILDKAILDSGS